MISGSLSIPFTEPSPMLQHGSSVNRNLVNRKLRLTNTQHPLTVHNQFLDATFAVHVHGLQSVLAVKQILHDSWVKTCSSSVLPRVHPNPWIFLDFWCFKSPPQQVTRTVRSSLVGATTAPFHPFRPLELAHRLGRAAPGAAALAVGVERSSPSHQQWRSAQADGTLWVGWDVVGTRWDRGDRGRVWAVGPGVGDGPDGWLIVDF